MLHVDISVFSSLEASIIDFSLYWILQDCCEGREVRQQMCKELFV